MNLEAKTLIRACSTHQARTHLILAETVYCSELSCAILVMQGVVMFYRVSITVSLTCNERIAWLQWKYIDKIIIGERNYRMCVVAKEAAAFKLATTCFRVKKKESYTE